MGRKKNKNLHKQLPKMLKQTSLSPAKSYISPTSRDTTILPSTINDAPRALFKTAKYIFRYLISFSKIVKKCNIKSKLKRNLLQLAGNQPCIEHSAPHQCQIRGLLERVQRLVINQSRGHFDLHK